MLAAEGNAKCFCRSGHINSIIAGELALRIEHGALDKYIGSIPREREQQDA